MHKNIFLAIIVITCIIACNENGADYDDSNAMNEDSLARNISILSSDSFQGRLPFTKGEKMTISFLQETYRTLGLEPGNNSSYLQEVPMVMLTAKADSIMTVKYPKGKFTLNAPKDYVVWTNKVADNITLHNTPVVFAGYGVNAPEYNWNDYAGIDVKGKIVLVMVNDPGFWTGDSTLFKGKTMTYYGRWTYKFEEAARQGAKGCLVIHRTRPAGYPFKVQQNGFNTARLQLDKRGKNQNECDALGWITDTAAVKLFEAAGMDSSLFQKANKKDFKPVPLNISVSTNMKVQSDYKNSYNVIGRITGLKRPGEVIIYTAHWDHLGINAPDAKGDSIYNGALDNASGVAGMIEIARAFTKMKNKPGRTILFIALTGEEQGLLGSEYYAMNPVYPPKNTVAEINIDGINNFGKTKDVVIVGRGQSELEDMMEDIVKKEGGYIVAEGHPEAGYYYRSDHYNFAKVGIPAIYQGSGYDIPGKTKQEVEKIRDDYTAKNYHRPSDEFDRKKWDLRGGLHDMHLLFALGKKLAYSDVWPEWKRGSEFRRIRDKDK
jgi:Zn-dependent M28 family amino/carboxypeptidase